MDYLPKSANNFQVYAESVVSSQWSVDSKGKNIPEEMLSKIGTPIKADELNNHIDFAFLCLHGAGGEDGSIQGLLEYLKIPYSGSGIISSALGMDKALQRKFMQSYGYVTPEYITVKRTDISEENLKKVHKQLKKKIGIPCVIKPSHQGSSIGATVLTKSDYASFEKAIYRSFFIQRITQPEWKSYSKEKQNFFHS